MNKYEYKIIELKIKFARLPQSTTSHFNELGADGWELVSAYPLSYYKGESTDSIAIFKRPLE